MAPLVEAVNRYGQTPVEIAVAKENVELVSAFSKLLVYKKERLSSMSGPHSNGLIDLKQILHEVFRSNDFQELKNFIYTTTPQTWIDESPLHIVSQYPEISPEILEFLIENFDINAHNLAGDTPLHAATIQAHLPLLTMLLPKADLYKKNTKHETALLAAISVDWQQINLDVIHILIKNAPVLAMIPLKGEPQENQLMMPESNSPLELAIRRNLFDVVKMLVDLGKVDVNYVTAAEGNTILHHLAAYTDQDERIIQYLLFTCKAFRAVNKRNKIGNTPLHMAAKYNNLKYVKRLLSSKKIEVKHLNDLKETALMSALSSNGKATNPTLLKALIERYPNAVNVPNLIGDLPINLALNTSDPELVKILIEESKISVEKWRDRHKNTLLHFIALYTIQDRFLCTYLISKAGSAKVINEKNVVGQTILHFMCRDDHPSLKNLLDHPNIDVAVLNADLNTPLMEYLRPERDFSEDILQSLIKVPLSRPNKHDETPLEKAIELFKIKDPVVVNSANERQKKPLLTMLKHGSIDFEFADKKGNSLFHLLARLVHEEELIRLFLGKFMADHKADLTMQMDRRNKDNRTPLDVARASKNDTFLDVIELS